jgi:hypothetical protein
MRVSGGAGPLDLSAARLNEIARRISTGYYDRPEVVDRMARRIRADLESGHPCARRQPSA